MGAISFALLALGYGSLATRLHRPGGEERDRAGVAGPPERMSATSG